MDHNIFFQDVSLLVLNTKAILQYLGKLRWRLAMNLDETSLYSEALVEEGPGQQLFESVHKSL